MIERGIPTPEYVLSQDYRLKRGLLPFIQEVHGVEEIEFLRLRPEINQLEIKAKDGRHMTAGEVAANNWRVMRSETVKAWRRYLENFFPEGFPGKEEISVFSLGPYGGLETGGILDWCRSHHIKAGIELYDLMACEPEKLPIFLAGKRYDLAIMREPGPFGGEANLKLWRAIFEAVVASGPAKILISSDDGCVREFLMGIREVELMTNWLSELGYSMEKPLTTYNLQYPSYLYGIQDRYWYLRIVDRVKVLFTRQT